MDGPMSSSHRTTDADPPDDRPTAVAKVVRVVEALTEHSGVSEISRKTGLPTSTVHRIIQELVSLGWVRGDGDHGYRPGAGLLTLSAQAASHAAMSIVVPILEHLRDATTHTIHFALRQGDQAVYVAKVEGQRAYEMRSRVGLAIPVHCTGIGKALLAALTEEEVRAILQRAGMPSRTPRTITDPEAMLEHLRTVARRGYAIDNEENELHTRCVAAVVRDHRGIATGGISMSAMAFEFDQERVQQVAPLVVTAARDVSQALGYRPTTAELAAVQRTRP
jgi:IclR family acetate operon transcriptional repressor